MPEVTDYEAERLKNIERNKQLLESFEIDKARNILHDIPVVSTTDSSNNNQRINKRPRVLTKSQPPPRRKSSRIRGIEPTPIQINSAEHVETLNEYENIENLDLGDEFWDGKLLKAEEYFDKETKAKAIITDGHYSGWLNPELMEKYQFEQSALEAWEKNGGGKFSYKDPLGTGTKRKYGSRTNAREIAHKMFKKNPNMYFYRHNEPGLEQWTGDWTDEEKEIFLKVAKEHGCGDKWGLFASYIPHRVGYQCSNYYRSVLLPMGLIFDENYQFTPSGKPIYVGAHNRGRSS
ncbi:unnamed protein product [Cunninghamella blakesleeana]